MEIPAELPFPGGLEVGELTTYVQKQVVSSETLSGTKTLTESDYSLQWLDPNGTDRIVTLPAEATSTSRMFIILNTGSANNIVVKNGTATTIATLAAGIAGMFSCDGITWKYENFGGGAGGGISSLVEDPAPQLGGVLESNGKQVRLSKGADVPSANVLTLGTDGNHFDITGKTAITSINSLGVGTVVTLHFDDSLTLTHHATDLVLPGGANITTMAGDEMTFVEYAAGHWRCICYMKADGVIGANDTIDGGSFS